jgi:putative PIN family toxin of toxin-antitoxin system
LRVVLDTNVVLDWLVFNRTGITALQQGLQQPHVAVVTSAAALDELQRVLTYPLLKLEAPRQLEVLALYQARTIAGTVPEGFSRDDLKTPSGFPRCKDRSDDHFLALAYHAAAPVLVSKDKEVLKLRKRAAKFGVSIVDVAQLLELLGAVVQPLPVSGAAAS